MSTQLETGVSNQPDAINDPNVSCAIMLTDGYQTEEKHNVSVILVPESVLQALRNSACPTSEPTSEALTCLVKQPGAEFVPVESCHGTTELGIAGVVGSTDHMQSTSSEAQSAEDNSVMASNSYCIPSTNQLLAVESSNCLLDGNVLSTVNSLNQYTIMSDSNSKMVVSAPENGSFYISVPTNQVASIQEDNDGSSLSGPIIPTQQTNSFLSGLNRVLPPNMVWATSEANPDHSSNIAGNPTMVPKNGKKVESIVVSMGANSDVLITNSLKKRKITQRDAPSTITYKCMVFNCKKTFESYEALEKHRNDHMSPKIYKCPHDNCPWSFKTPYKLKRHIESHDQNKQYSCKYPGCETVCSTSYNLRAHEKMHSDGSYLRCDECNETFRHKHRLQKHFRLVHNVAPKFPCCFENCNRKFHSSSALTTHMNSHNNPKTEFICPFESCSKKFKKPCIFREHVMSQHTDIRPYKCEFQNCSWAFTTMSKLRRHQMTHTQNKRFVCPVEVCPRRFHRLEHLKCHLKVHSAKVKDAKSGTDEPELPIESNEDNLVYYLCPYEECGSLFTTLVGAKQHIQKLHGPNSKQTAEHTDSAGSTDSAPVSITLVGDVKSDSESDIPPKQDKKIAVVVTAETPLDTGKEKSKELAAAAEQDVQALLTTIIQNEAGGSRPQEIVIESDPPLQSGSNLTTTAPELEFTSVGPMEPACTSSNSTREDMELGQVPDFALLPERTHLDPSTYLAGNLESVSGSLPSREVVDFIAISSQSVYPTSTSADRFLNFNECVPTVDPNAVMSVPSSCMVQHPSTSRPSSSSAFDSTDEEDADSNNSLNYGGSARTDCNAYRRACIGKKSNGTSLFTAPKPAYSERNIISESGGKPSLENPNSVLDAALSSFIGSHRFKAPHAGNLRGSDFPGSTINLSDLA